MEVVENRTVTEQTWFIADMKALDCVELLNHEHGLQILIIGT